MQVFHPFGGDEGVVAGFFVLFHPHMFNCLFGSQAFFWVNLEQAVEEIYRVYRKPVKVAAVDVPKLDFAHQDAIVDPFVVGEVTSKHGISDHADLPHISRLVVLRQAAKHFRGLVDPRAHLVRHSLVVEKAG